VKAKVGKILCLCVRPLHSQPAGETSAGRQGSSTTISQKERN